MSRFANPQPRSVSQRRPRPVALYAQITIVVLCLIVVIGFDPLHTRTREGAEAGQGEGDIVRQLSYLLLFGFGLLNAGVLRDVRKLLVLPASITVVVAYFYLSLTWAIEPSIALRRLTLAVLLIWIVFSAVPLAGYERTLSGFRSVMLATLVLNYFAIAILPSAVHAGAEMMDPNLAGNWRGVQSHKNFAGPAMAILILLFLFDMQGRRLFRLAVIAAAAFFLYKSSSKTSAILLGAAAASGWAIGLIGMRYRTAALLIFGYGLLLGILSLPLVWDDMGEIFGRDSFTGRMYIWQAMLAFSADHWLGAGYGSFWNIGSASPIQHYASGWVSRLFIGHNGYLDLLVQVGPIGLALAVIMTLVVPIVKLFKAKDVPRSRLALLISLMVFCIGHNLTESSLYERDQMMQIFLMITVATIHLVARRPAALRSLAADAGKAGRSAAA